MVLTSVPLYLAGRFIFADNQRYALDVPRGYEMDMAEIRFTGTWRDIMIVLHSNCMSRQPFCSKSAIFHFIADLLLL